MDENELIADFTHRHGATKPEDVKAAHIALLKEVAKRFGRQPGFETQISDEPTPNLKVSYKESYPGGAVELAAYVFLREEQHDVHWMPVGSASTRTYRDGLTGYAAASKSFQGVGEPGTLAVVRAIIETLDNAAIESTKRRSSQSDHDPEE